VYNICVCVCVVTVKARRKTATAEDLLFAGGASDGSHLAAASPVVMPARAAVVVNTAVVNTGAPAALKCAELGGSPPERDSTLVQPTKPTTARVSRYVTSSVRCTY